MDDRTRRLVRAYLDARIADAAPDVLLDLADRLAAAVVTGGA